MELPKNTTQIGEVQGSYKVFIEDYVISYLKQLCRQEPDRKKRIAFYGIIRTEGPLQYFFIYGGSEVQSHGWNDMYLTKEDYEEITWVGGRWFGEYVPLGFTTLEEELPEELYLFLSGREVKVPGYHIFYEKNESMLAFLVHRQAQLEERQQQERLAEESAAPVAEARVVSVKAQPEAVAKNEAAEPRIFGIVKSAAAALFIVLCVTALSTMNGFGKMEDLHHFFQKAIQTMTEKKLPDRENVLPVSTESITENDWAYQMEKENQQAVGQETVVEEPQEMTGQREEPEADVEKKEPEAATEEEKAQEPEAAAEEEKSQEPVKVVQTEEKVHIIKKGETLISISKMYYGDDSRVKAICELNGIANCDTIQIGQKIVLP